MRFLSLLCRADFMQMMILSTILFLLPLNKRQHWKWRLLLIAIPALIISVTLTMFVAANEWTFESSVLYYPAPLIASVLIFRVCSQEPLQDAVYGMGCAYASQHIAFCVITILWGEHWITLASPLLIGSWLVQTALLLLCWCFFARTLPVDGAYAVSWRKALLHTGIVILIAMILNRIVRSVWQSADLTSYNISLAYDLCSCLFILVLQLEQSKKAWQDRSCAHVYPTGGSDHCQRSLLCHEKHPGYALGQQAGTERQPEWCRRAAGHAH